jgi:hypothetical protein
LEQVSSNGVDDYLIYREVPHIELAAGIEWSKPLETNVHPLPSTNTLGLRWREMNTPGRQAS